MSGDSPPLSRRQSYGWLSWGNHPDRGIVTDTIDCQVCRANSHRNCAYSAANTVPVRYTSSFAAKFSILLLRHIFIDQAEVQLMAVEAGHLFRQLPILNTVPMLFVPPRVVVPYKFPALSTISSPFG
jgi:hypothetical protein